MGTNIRITANVSSFVFVAIRILVPIRIFVFY